MNLMIEWIKQSSNPLFWRSFPAFKPFHPVTTEVHPERFVVPRQSTAVGHQTKSPQRVGCPDALIPGRKGWIKKLKTM